MPMTEIPSQIDLATLNVFLGARSVAVEVQRQRAKNKSTRLTQSGSSSFRDSCSQSQLTQSRMIFGDSGPVPAIPDRLLLAAKPAIGEQDCEIGSQTVGETLVF